MILKNISMKCILGAKILLPVLFVLTGCTKDETKAYTSLESRGKATYMSNCTACHNQDPRLSGSIGPEIADSSIELLRERILHQSYPAGYKPKRNSGLMPALPFLEADIPALHAYIKSFSKK